MQSVHHSKSSDEYYAEREARLRGLMPVVREALPEETHAWFKEYLDHGEYGLAVEVASEPIPDEPQGIGYAARRRALTRGGGHELGCGRYATAAGHRLLSVASA
jgi:hypothetical protein